MRPQAINSLQPIPCSCGNREFFCPNGYFWHATDAARRLRRHVDGDATGERLITVAEAIDQYEADLKAREPANAERLRPRLKPAFAPRPVGLPPRGRCMPFVPAGGLGGIKEAVLLESIGEKPMFRDASRSHLPLIHFTDLAAACAGVLSEADVPCSYPMSLPPWWRRDFSTGLRDLRHSVG